MVGAYEHVGLQQTFFFLIALIIFLNFIWFSWWKRKRKISIYLYVSMCIYIYTGDDLCIHMLWITCTPQVLCENISPTGLLALRKDLSRNHELCCKTRLNKQLLPRSHNAENEIFGLCLPTHQRCSTDVPRHHFLGCTYQRFALACLTIKTCKSLGKLCFKGMWMT